MSVSLSVDEYHKGKALRCWRSDIPLGNFLAVSTFRNAFPILVLVLQGTGIFPSSFCGLGCTRLVWVSCHFLRLFVSIGDFCR